MSTDILNYWPMKNSQPRKSQINVLQWMQSLPNHIRYVLCEVPVGGGKSPIAINYSAYLSGNDGNSYILTPQKILQKQYEDSFNSKYLASLYGKNNYTCESKNSTCEVGSLIKPKCESCPFTSALNRANNTANVVFNYKLALLIFKYLSGEKLFPKRKLLVFDECHTLESHLTDFNAIQIGEKRCKQMNINWKEFDKQIEALNWIRNSYVLAVEKMIAKLAPEVDYIIEKGTVSSKHEQELISKYTELTTHLASITEFLLLGNDAISERYVFVPDKTFFKFKELYGKHVFRELVEPMAEKFLFMSSTILDKDAYCRDLGIDPAYAAFISVDSEFKIENRPILYLPKMKMTYGWNASDKKSERDSCISSIIEILDYHKNDNGIIHTGSFQIASWLIKNLERKIPHKILHHGEDSEDSRDKVINDFQIDDGDRKLLISPSITEGLDLKNDKGRFAIVAKVPYPYLGDAWVKRRQDLSKEWYSRQAMIHIIQGGGRIVRTPDDWGHVYILDESFASLLRFMKDKVPQWWLDSLET